MMEQGEGQNMVFAERFFIAWISRETNDGILFEGPDH